MRTRPVGRDGGGGNDGAELLKTGDNMTVAAADQGAAPVVQNVSVVAAPTVQTLRATVDPNLKSRAMRKQRMVDE